MIFDGLEFHNIAELATVEGQAGVRLQRAPEAIRPQLDEGTAGVMLSPANSEIRFRLKDGKEATSIRLSADEPTVAHVYYGPFQGPMLALDTEPKDYVIKPHARLDKLPSDLRAEFTYDPGLMRICFGGAYPEPVFYHGHGDGVVLPREGDVPAKLLLAYGSSIAHGTDQSGAALSYPAHTAWKLGYDLRNLGTSGCCLCEPALADYLAEQPCDLMTLELSVNMLGRGFTAEAFRERAAYLVACVANADPGRSVVCITIFPHYNDISESFHTDGMTATSDAYRQVLRDIVKDLARPNVHLVEGPELLRSLEGLSGDLIHPGARGMIEIGENLAQYIEELKPRVELCEV